MWAFLATTLGRYVVGGALLALIAGGGFLWIKTHYENIGYQKALDAVEKQNQRAIGTATEAIRDVRVCFDSGGTWNVETGRCDKN